MGNWTSNWKTAAQISQNYVVGEDRLLSYGQRGNLPFRRLPDGSMLFDELAVATFFRPRGVMAPANANADPPATTLGVLGTVRLGERATSRPLDSEAPPASEPSRPIRHRKAQFGRFEQVRTESGTHANIALTERKATG